MVGIDHNKIAEIKEAKGYLKKAADHYSAGGNRNKALELYEEVLSKNPGMDVIRDIRGRLVKLDAPEELKEFALKVSKRGLDRMVGTNSFAVIAVGFLLIASFFISFNFTGYSIGGLTRDNFTLISLGLFILGLVFTLFYIKNKKK